MNPALLPLPEPDCVVCLGAGERYAHDRMVTVELQKPEGVSFPAGTQFYTADHVRAIVANLSARPVVGVDDAMVEVMARWFCIRDGFDPDATHTAYVGGIDESWPEWCNHVEEARDALTAALSAKGDK